MDTTSVRAVGRLCSFTPAWRRTFRQLGLIATVIQIPLIFAHRKRVLPCDSHDGISNRGVEFVGSAY